MLDFLRKLSSCGKFFSIKTPSITKNQIKLLFADGVVNCLALAGEKQTRSWSTKVPGTSRQRVQNVACSERSLLCNVAC